MAGIVPALTDGRAGEIGERGAGLSCPGLEGGGEGEGAAVKDVPAALPGDEGVQGGEGASLAGQGEDVSCGTSAGPVPGGQPGQPGQPVWCAGVVPGEPLVEQARREASAGGDGGCGTVRDSGWAYVQGPV
jgi:hypothetical protein